MTFENYSNNWFTIALDTEKQVFIAGDKLNPAYEATGITIESAVQNLKTIMAIQGDLQDA
ncbi:hypothetical protein [Pediococcus cellicola]|uniref:HicB-like antitoxin of toxin-antitoxin system domain-containing protein n=1 Tax=Pediococcus cellicola TaxID=319652 RepID=A0A0R2IQ59_9LACO|nr:hypothetical protein [Pediococcus cellicola]KRN67281.1 hypothetical protein IV80_GL000817 [Pediococcus cellicola]GEL14925.1 hypothetical protein PCE01_07270 [Pediococcus cellicola]